MTFKVKDGISIAGSGFVDGSRNVTANNTTLTGELRGPATFVIDPAAVGDNTGTVVIKGDLQVDGTTTTINSTTLSVDDKNIELGSVTTPTDTTADGGGITLKGTTDKTFSWVNATDAWTSSEHIAIAAGKNLIVNGQSSGSITVRAPIIAGTQEVYLPAATGNLALTSDIKDATITLSAGAGLTGGGSFTLNQASNGTVSFAHADTSTAANLTASGRTYVTGLTFDTYGHVTGYTTGTETVTDTNTITRLRGTASGTYQSGDLTLLSGTGVTVSQVGTDYTITNSGVTSLVAGNAITVSGATGAVTVNHADTSSVANLTAATNTFISGITFDTYGHVQTVTTGSPSGFLTGNQTITLTGDTTGSGATSIATTTNYISGSDDRIKAPSDDLAFKMRFGFTSWANNNTSPYADYIHLRSYSDSSGGNDNLVMFRKDAIGMRIWQQSFGSATAYATYKDVAFTDQIPTVNNGTLTLSTSAPLSGSATFTANQSTASTFTVSHSNSGVTAGTYNNVTVNATGHVTSGSNVAYYSSSSHGPYIRDDVDDSFSGNLTSASGKWLKFYHTSETDSNDGKIGSGVFASGLNIVGTQTTAGTGRQIRLWGSVIDDAGTSFVKNSGTWSINVTGSAGTVSSIGTTQVTHLYSPNGATVVSPDATTAMPSNGQSFIHTLGTGPSGNDGHLLAMSWANTTTVYGAQLWLDTDPTNRMALRSRSSAGVWNSWSEVITSNNIGSYSSVPTFQTLNIDANGNLDYNKYDINSTATINIKNMPLNFTGSGTLSISSSDLILTL